MPEYNRRNSRSWSIMGLNPSVWSVGVAEVMDRREDVCVITADLARYSGLSRIAGRFPDRFYNVGIAEQNMVGVAAGLALEGCTVFVTTYAPFVTFRCADQVRHLMGNHRLNIKAVGSAAGVTGGWSGPALNAVNDIAFMRSVPNMVVLSPADCAEAVKMVGAMADIDAPTYLRLCGSTRIPAVYQEDFEFEIGRGAVLREGADLALVATGPEIVPAALKAAGIIEDRCDRTATVVDMHTIKPLDANLVSRIMANHPLVVTVEEHSVLGGLGGAVAECMSDGGSTCRLKRLGLPDGLLFMGSRQFMLAQAGLTAEGIAAACMAELGEGR